MVSHGHVALVLWGGSIPPAMYCPQRHKQAWSVWRDVVGRGLFWFGQVGYGNVQHGHMALVLLGRSDSSRHVLPERAQTGRGGEKCGWAWLGRVWSGKARHGIAWELNMPKKRQDRETWAETRRKVWLRDEGRCQGPYCHDLPAWSLPLEVCHIDHIKSGKLGTNHISNLRVLCRRCHVLRADQRHRGMIAKALQDGIIPPDWRSLVWEG